MVGGIFRVRGLGISEEKFISRQGYGIEETYLLLCSL